MNGNHKPVTAFLALGSNLGDRMAHLRGARQALHGPPEICVISASSIYETAPVGGPAGQPPYLNAVLEVQTLLDASRLLDFCLTIEQQFGRSRQIRWGARSLDIDLLFYATSVHRQQHLMVPHPRVHQRAFVLIPMLEIAPELLHPLLQQTVRQMLTQLPSTAGVRRLPDHW